MNGTDADAAAGTSTEPAVRSDRLEALAGREPPTNRVPGLVDDAIMPPASTSLTTPSELPTAIALAERTAYRPVSV